MPVRAYGWERALASDRVSRECEVMNGADPLQRECRNGSESESFVSPTPVRHDDITGERGLDLAIRSPLSNMIGVVGPAGMPE